MPIYEYRCQACDQHFEALMFPADDTAPVCPSCNGSDVEKLMSAGFVRPKGIPTGSGGFTQPSCKPSG